MTLFPQISKKDDLYKITYISDVCFKSKYIHWALYYSLCYTTVYVSLLFRQWITKPEKLAIFDIMGGALILVATMNCVSLFDETKKIREINQIREQHFWDNDFFSKQEKDNYGLETKISLYAHYISWVYTVLLILALIFDVDTPQILYQDHWPRFAKLGVRCLFILYVLFGYYMTNTHEAYFAHIILHGCFQMNTLIIYLRHEFPRYKEMSLTDKVNSYKYQTEAEVVLKRCVKHHQKLTEYGKRTSAMYRRLSVIRVAISIVAASVGTYYWLYDPYSSTALSLLGFAHISLGVLLYCTIGQQFLLAYENFHRELFKLDWYSLNRSNKQLYYMFLIFTKNEFGIEILPSLYLSRPFLTRLLRSIYAGLTFLASTVHQSSN